MGISLRLLHLGIFGSLARIVRVPWSLVQKTLSGRHRIHCTVTMMSPYGSNCCPNFGLGPFHSKMRCRMDRFVFGFVARLI